MGIDFLAQAIGILVTVGVLFLIISFVVTDAEWTRAFRVIVRYGKSLNESTQKRMSIWLRYLASIERDLNVLDITFNMQNVCIRLFVVAVVVFAVSALLRYPLLLGVPAALGASLVVNWWWYHRKAVQRRDSLAYMYIVQGVPVALHTLNAVNRLDLAIERMASLVRYQPLRQRLERLRKMSKQPQYPTAQDAFTEFAATLGIPEIRAFATVTKVAQRYDGDLDKLWTYMSELLGRDHQYVRNQKAKTAYHRNGGLIFYGMLAGALLLSYPLARKYMTGFTQILLFVAIAIMTFFLWLIFRDSQSIDV